MRRRSAVFRLDRAFRGTDRGYSYLYLYCFSLESRRVRGAGRDEEEIVDEWSDVRGITRGTPYSAGSIELRLSDVEYS